MRRTCSVVFVLAAALLICGAQALASDLTLTVGGKVTIELISSSADFHDTLSLLSPNASIATTGCKVEGTSFAGLKLLSEKISQHGCRVELDADPATNGIQPFAAGAVLNFNLCAQEDANPATCEHVWSSNQESNTDSFDHVRTTQIDSTDYPGKIFQLAWEDLKEGGDQDFNDLIAVVRIDMDSDGDGLWDDWEKFGIDANGDGVSDLTLPGADPQHKDIYIEIDYMDCSVQGSDCAPGDTHSHRPKDAARQAVIDAFANAISVVNPDGSTGITLHIDVDDAIPHQNILGLGCPGSGTSFDTVKADPANFGPLNPRRFAYHYAVFAHQQAANTTSSGCGEIWGNDFLVTLGEWHTVCINPGANGVLNTSPAGDDRIINGVQIYAGPNLTCETTATGDDVQVVANGTAPPADPDGDTLEDRTVGTVPVQAGTLIHEFGHNLKLNHGGGDTINYKPNYLSTMNYSFQMWGIPPTDPDGAGPLAGRVDYSSDDLPDLNEDKNLSEPAGIGDGTDTTQYVCPTGGWGFGPGTGAIDWNCNNDGGVETGVSVDINGDGVVNGLANPLTGYDDWDKLKFDFQNASPNFEDGFHLTSDVQEMDYLTYLQIPASMAIDIKPFSDPNSIDSRAKGVVPVAICNGGPVSNRVDIPDPSNPNGFDNALTNIDVSSIEFAVNASGDPLGAKVAGAEHNLSDPFVLGGHLTEYIDSDFDGIPDRLVPIDAPNCPGDPAGPDLVVHFRTRNTGLASGHTKACVTAKLAGGATIIGCDSVNVVK